MKKRYRILTWATFCILGLFVYNYWSFSCGYCTLESLRIISWPAKILIGINLLAASFLLLLNFRARSLDHARNCNCGQPLISAWRYCPACGTSR